MTITYTNLVEKEIQMSCDAWKNPMLPMLVQRIKVKTLTKDAQLIDDSVEFVIDTTGF